MKMRLGEPPISIKIDRFQQTARNGFNINHLQTAEFHKAHQGLECGSGPGGRRFKSSLPDHSFQSLTVNFWSAALSGVDEFEAAKASEINTAKFRAAIAFREE